MLKIRGLRSAKLLLFEGHYEFKDSDIFEATLQDLKQPQDENVKQGPARQIALRVKSREEFRTTNVTKRRRIAKKNDGEDEASGIAQALKESPKFGKQVTATVIELGM